MRRNLSSLVLATTPAVGLSTMAVTAAVAAPSPNVHAARVCATSSVPTVASCLSMRLVNDAGQAVSPSGGVITPKAISGKTPADIQNAYKLTGQSSSGRTVAIVDAYGYPKAEQDLAVYRSQWGLAPCTKANGCLRIIDQNGGTSYPRYDNGWAQEQALDLDAVSARPAPTARSCSSRRPATPSSTWGRRSARPPRRRASSPSRTAMAVGISRTPPMAPRTTTRVSP